MQLRGHSGLRCSVGQEWPRVNTQYCAPCHVKRAPQLTVLASSAAAAPSNLNFSKLLASSTVAPTPLPKPPATGTLTDVVPYLLKLALAEKHMLWRVAAAFGFLLISKAAGMLGPLTMKAAVDAFAINAGAPLPVLIQAVSQCLLIYGLLDMVKSVAKEAQAPLFTPVTQAASRRVSYYTFAHLLDLDTQFHLDRRTGRLNRILERGARSIQMLYRLLIFTFIPTGLELLIVACILSSRFSPQVGALVVATFCMYGTYSIWLTQVAADARKLVVELDNATSAKAVDALLMFETVTVFNNQALETAGYNTFLKQFQNASLTTDYLAAKLNAGQAIILTTGLTAILLTALHTAGPSVSAGDLVLLQGLLLQLWVPLNFLGWMYRELRSCLVDMEDFFGILRTQPTLVDGPYQLPSHPLSASHTVQGSASNNGNGVSSTSSSYGVRMEHLEAAAALPQGSGLLSHDSDLASATVNNSSINHSNGASTSQQGDGVEVSSGSWNGVLDSQPAQPTHAVHPSHTGAQAQGLLIEFNDVHFGYAADRQILHGLNLRVEPGQSLALVGPSGSGKSTVLKLITRLYDVTGGSVALNGRDVRDVTRQSLRAAVAVVPQDTVLFNDSIMQNIRYGRPEATDAEVIAAAKLAHLNEAVERMPLGYDTAVGERGLKLSGGEKQRVAIARAFLKAPRLLICDEATSALDSGTESSIIQALNELAVGRTSILVAHRLSTVRWCDTICVVKQGRLVESGSHDELMARPGSVYKEMWELQARVKEDDSGSITDADEDAQKALTFAWEAVHGTGATGRLTTVASTAASR